MPLAQTLAIADWTLWIGYVVLFAAASLVLTWVWSRPGRRVSQASLATWELTLVIALGGALGLSQWRSGTVTFAAMVAFGLAAAIMLSAAVNASYGLGLRDRARSRDAHPAPVT